MPTGGTPVRRRGNEVAAGSRGEAPRPRALAWLRRDIPPHASYLGQRRFASLNGLRCLAISEVIWHHSSGSRSGIMARGIGVDLSFVISGFLITTLHIREFSKTGRIDVRRFYLRRTLRIFPLYFAVLGLYLLLVLTTRRGTPEGIAFLHHLPAFATYTSDWFVSLTDSENIFYFAWSLATQEQFYLLWAPALLLCLAFGRTWRAGAVLIVLILVGEVARNAISGHDIP